MLETPIQDKRRWWSREDLILLILLGALYFFPGLSQIPLFDRDEPRFATAARTMDQTHNYIVPMFNGHLRPDKPPLIYWLMNLSASALGSWSELAVRLPSAIAGTLSLLVVYFMTGARFGRVTGLIASLILGSCVLFMFMSHMATADATMVFFIVICMACVWQAWDAGPLPTPNLRQHLPRTDYLLDRTIEKPQIVLDHLPLAPRRKMSAGLALLFWISLAAGVMTKGVPLFFVFIPMISLSLATGALPDELRRWRSHLHITRTRIIAAIAAAGIAAALILTTYKTPAGPEITAGSAILAVLLLLMLLTPGLPSLLLRCTLGGNWAWWKQFRFLWGVPLLIALVAWWVILAGIDTNWTLINDMVGTHFLNRVAGPLLKILHIHLTDSQNPTNADPLSSYGQPPGFYLLLVWATFWPWSVLLVPAAYHAIRRVLGKTPIALDPRPYQFLIAWIVPMWVLLELARGKLLHYPLPLYVGLSILCADALVQSWHRLTDVLAAPWFAHMKWGMLIIWLSMAAGVIVGMKYVEPGPLVWWCVPLAGAFAAAGVAGVIAWNRPSYPFVIVLAWGGALLYANTFILPEMSSLRVSKIAGERIAQLQKENPTARLAAVGYQEGTLVFYAGHDIEMLSLDQMLKTIPFAPREIPTPEKKYILTVNQKAIEALQLSHLAFTGSPRITGLDTGDYKPTTIWVITNTTARAPTSSGPATVP